MQLGTKRGANKMIDRTNQIEYAKKRKAREDGPEGMKEMQIPTYALANGVKMPKIGFGTWQSKTADGGSGKICH
ncbi:MAG: hypothetical protein ACLT0Y_05390 [Christensenellales bacterium]